MTGISLFLLGIIAISNFGLLTILILDRNGQNGKEQPPNAGKEPPPPVDPIISETSIGKSTFNIEDYEERMKKAEEKVQIMTAMIDRLEGDVGLRDVEFTNPEDTPTNTETEEEFVPRKFSRMTPEEESAAFEDVRIDDVEPDMVSAPSASGISMEELESSVNTAMNPNASVEEKVRAGRILNSFADTNFMDRLTTVEEVQKGVLECIRAEYRKEMVGDNKIRRQSRKSKPPVIPDNINDFNPADLLKR